MKRLIVIGLLACAIWTCSEIPTDPKGNPGAGTPPIENPYDPAADTSAFSGPTIYLDPGVARASPNTDVRVSLNAFQIPSNITGMHIVFHLGAGITFSGIVDTAGFLQYGGGTVLGWADVSDDTLLTVDLVRVGDPIKDSALRSNPIAHLHFTAAISGHINVGAVALRSDTSYAPVTGVEYRNGWIDVSGE
jgi:hypothetical protein